MSGLGAQLRQAADIGIAPKTALRQVLDYESDFDLSDPSSAVDPGRALGAVANVGAGLVNSTLRLGRGINWLANTASDLLTGHLPEGHITGDRDWGIPKSVVAALPEEQGLRLESRLARSPARGAFETAGQVLSLVAGNAGGVLGKAVGQPGQVIKAFGTPGAALGSKLLEKIPSLGRWAGLAEKLVPAAVQGATGFGLYNLMTEEGSMRERAAAMGHGLLAGGAMGVLGEVANAAERGILNKLASLAEREGFANVLRQTSGEAPPDLALWKKLTGAGVAAAIENTGLVGMSGDWWGDLIGGLHGDDKKLYRAMETWAASYPATLMARGLDPRTARREHPETNTLDQRLLTHEPPQQPGAQGQEPNAPIRPDVRPDPIVGFEPTVPPQTDTVSPGREAPWSLPALNQATDPLFKSGWEMAPEVTLQDGKHTVTMEFPGAGSVKFREDIAAPGEPSAGFVVEMPASVYNAVRGTKERGTVTLGGPEAQEFARDLATVSILRRIRGELLLGQGGEAWAGGPWRAGSSHVAIGLDGHVYARDAVPSKGADWERIPTPPMPILDGPTLRDPQIQRWVDLAQTLRQTTAENPGIDLLESSIGLVVGGDPNSKSVQETTDLLARPWQPGVSNADIAASLLRPGNIEQFGLTVGQVAAGHLTAQAARQQIGTALVGSPQGRELPPPSEPAGASGEAGFLDIGAAGKALGDAGKKAGQAIASGASFAVEDVPRLLARKGGAPGVEMGRRVRNVLSRTRSLLGEMKTPLRAQSEALHAQREALSQDVDVGGVTMPRWVAITQGKVQPTTGEIPVADAINEALLTSHDAFRKAGGLVYAPSGSGWSWQQPSERDTATVQRVYSTKEKGGYSEVMGTQALRDAFWADVAKLNPKLGLTGPQLAAINRQAEKAMQTRDPEKVAAIEQARVIQNIPATWTHNGKSYEILEHDPIAALHHITERQAARVATIEEPGFGQDLPNDVRQQFGIARPGISNAFEQFSRALNTGDKRLTDQLTAVTRDLLDRMQGREPVRLGGGLTALRELVSLPRAFGAWLSGISDVGAMLSEPIVYGGARRLISTVFDYVVRTGPRSVAEAAERAGTLAMELGNLDTDLARTPLSRLSELISQPSNFLERHKTAFFDRVATRILEDWQAGRIHSSDLDLPKLLRMTTAEQQALLGNTASTRLKNKFRHELVQVMTSRGRKAERSQLAASPLWTTLIRYTGFASKQLQKLSTEFADFAKAMKPGTGWAAKGRAAKAVAYRALGMQAAGLLGTFLYYVIADGLFKQQNGAGRFYRELSNFPTKTMGKAMVQGALAGPYALLYRGLTDDDPSALAQTNEITAPVVALHNALARGGGPLDLLYRVAENTGLVPRQLRTLATSIQLRMLGTSEMEGIDKSISEWKRLSGVKPVFGELNKPPEFYAAMDKVDQLLKGHVDGDLWATVKPEVQKALGVSSEESVAAKIRSLQLLSGLDDAQISKLTEFLGPEAMRKAHDHDAAVLQVAREAARLDGADATPWQQALDLAEDQARLGGNNVWGDAMERAVEAKANEFKTQEPSLLDLNDLASRMARYPLALEREAALPPIVKQGLGKMDQQQIERALVGSMIERAAGRMKRGVTGDAKRAAGVK